LSLDFETIRIAKKISDSHIIKYTPTFPSTDNSEEGQVKIGKHHLINKAMRLSTTS
jgi:hypothetical protein